MLERLSCDLLIVGGGGAGLRTAIAARELYPKLNVLLVTKGVLGKSGVTATACSDRMAFHATLPHTPPGGPENWRYHAEDIYRIGGQVSDWDLARVLARKSAEAFGYLDDLGVPFARQGGVVRQFVTDGSQYPRACYTGPKTAIHIEERLVGRFKELNIPVIEFCMIAKLLCRNGKIVGALAVDTRKRLTLSPTPTAIQTKSIILATGGAGLIFRHNVFPAGMTGDGYALAYEAGAELVNMEFVQIGIASTKTKLNCSGSMLRAVPRFIDDTGREFLAGYLPPGTSGDTIHALVFRKGASWPVAYEHDTRVIDVAVYRKVQAGHRVYLDYAHNPQGFVFSNLPDSDRERYQQEVVNGMGEAARQSSPLRRLQEINPDSVQRLEERGVNLIAGDKVEIACCGQHFQGGVKIRASGDTTVSGLYAVGEVAGGQHGANRPGGNALLDCQVFGEIAGEAAATEAMSRPGADVAAEAGQHFGRHLRRYAGGNGCHPLDFRRQLQNVVECYASVVRTEAGLKKALEGIETLKNMPVSLGNRSVAYGLENDNLLVVAEMVIRAALCREESRGPHLRFPDYTGDLPLARKDPEWQRYIVISRRGQDMVLEKRKPRDDGKVIVEEGNCD